MSAALEDRPPLPRRRVQVQVAPPISPPPLPPRTPQPVEAPPSAVAPMASPLVVDTQTPSTPRVDITPATPPQPLSPVDRVTTSFGQSGDAIKSAPIHTQASYDAPEPPASAPLLQMTPQKNASPDLGLSSGSLQGAAEEDAVPATITKNITMPRVEAVVIVVLILNLFTGRISITWTTILGAVYAFYTYQAKGAPPRATLPELPVRPSEGRAAVQWVNHALYALFPLISTDVLTPFIDLLEDALIQQVPPIVTSVRLTSASLGNQPLLLTSMRPLTDQEWFASLATAQAGSSKEEDQGRESKVDRAKSKGHARTASGVSNLSRSHSASSFSSAVNVENVALETSKRRKRDRVLQRVKGRHNDRPADTSSFKPRTGEDPALEAQQPDGERHRGGPDGMEVDAEDANVGQFVNYQVGFEYARSGPAKKKGWGLHVLAYFGWGVKGVGNSEIPVYIDVLSIKGTLNLRLLLSATPPFIRTATFSFVTLPEFDISATPLKQGSFNAMELPGMKTYVQKSIAAVAKAFVRPESYSIDLDRLLLGREASLRTYTVGVMHIIIHGAEDLPKTDTVGSCDPYAMICLTKFRKPVFSTRTIIDTQNPSWEEEAFVLISSDAIESGERLRLRLVDSDRFSADDAMGVVEVDITDLVEQAESLTPDQPPTRRIDMLTAERPGMKTSGRLEWSVRFCPLWHMSQKELEKKMTDGAFARPGEPTEADMRLPSWLRWINNYMDVPNWEAERAKRRQDTIHWFTGEKEREEAEAAAPPSDELRSGILQFHIHQCVDLEVDSLEGTYSSALSARLSAAGGKPALAEEIDRTPAENPDPPSAYCEVHLNDRLVYRTRTKQVTPLPYFNAVSERFLRDWRMAKIVFVVRDERDREHDPILGLVTLYLKDVLKDQSHFTRWFPLSTGLGWGRIRISLLFKPIDMRLPPRISGYEIATLELTSLAATDLSRMTDRNISVMLETECDRFILDTAGDEDGNRSSTSIEPFSPSGPATPGTPGTAASTVGTLSDANQVEWEITKPIKLAVQYRHSSSVVISFITRSKVVKKKKVLAVAVCRLGTNPDGETGTFTVPIYNTADVQMAVKNTTEWLKTSDTALSTQTSNVSRRRSFGHETRIIGYVTLTMAVHPGISQAHKRLCKKDLRFAKVYEAWENYRDVVARRAHTRQGKMVWSEQHGEEAEEDMDESDTTEDEDGMDGDVASTEELRRTISENEMIDAEDVKSDGFFAERRAHSKALHKKHKGIFQLKIVRTGQFVKDKIEAKVRSSNRDRRRGDDLDVEHEGQSAI